MLRKFDFRILFGLLLILGGGLFLLENLGILPLGSLFWGTLLAAGGVYFVGWFAMRREHWWALIPGFTLLGLASTVLVSVFSPRLGNLYGGTLLFGGIAVGFFGVYATAPRAHWWALIPGGVLFTLGVVSHWDARPLWSGIDSGGVFFLGLSITFWLVYLLPPRQSWAFFPAAALLAFAFLVFAPAAITQYWPVLLIVAGILLLVRSFGGKA
ncbi:MAG: hypothetical protein OHK0052_23790 [Anaerolineales bacterium]